MFAIAENLGVGIYSPAEAAMYARVSRMIMTRWVFGGKDGKPVIRRQLNDPTERIVTFLDFVQTLAVREVRNRHKLSLQKIRSGVEMARSRYGIEYPLARKHTIYLFSDQKGEGHGEIIVRLPGDASTLDEQYIQVTGKERGNRMMQSVVEMFLDDLRFDHETQLATLYTPMKGGGASVILDPHRQFGTPIVEPGGYTAETLWHATNTEGGIEAAAEAYGVGVNEVTLANKYFDSLLPSPVA